MKICTVYVTYNPDIEYLKKSISAIEPQVQNIVIVDNSDIVDHQQKVKELGKKNIFVLTQYRNVGIAAALNVGCKKAIELEASWVLTLDQDSLVPEDMIFHYKNFINKNHNLKIGAIGPLFNSTADDRFHVEDTAVKASSLITSGCFMNMDAFTEVGGFRDELFIDSVDTEYSWNLRKHGYELYQLNSLILEHHIGAEAFHIKVMGKRIMTITNHNYIRCYYIARNSKQISHDYKDIFPENARFYSKKALKKFVMVLLYEKDKLRKVRAIAKGVHDYKKGKLGVYDGK